MRRARMTRGVVLGTGLLLWTTVSYGQASSNARACGLLPIPELEAHFAGKVISVNGADSGSMSMCTAMVADRRHAATLESRPPAAGRAVTVEQTLAEVKRFSERTGKPTETGSFGSVGCFNSKLDVGGTPQTETTCFLAQGGHLSLSLRNVDPKQVSFEAVKGLLDKAAARRK